MWRTYVLPALGKMKVAGVAPDDIDQLHREITALGKPIRANRIVASLRKAFNLAIRWRLRTDNPATELKFNPEQPRTRYLRRNEIEALVKALADSKQRSSAAVIMFLLLTGARRGEVLSAEWKHFDLVEGTWTKPSAHTKQRRAHRVPLSRPAIELLRHVRTEAEARASKNAIDLPKAVFAGQSGAALVDIKRTWATARKAAGIEGVRLHDLRHSFASILVSGGMSLPMIGQMLGHTQTSTTARYSHLFDDPLRKAAETVGQFVLQGNGGSDGHPRPRQRL